MYIRYSSWMKHWDFILSDLICINLSLYLAFIFRFFSAAEAVSNNFNMYAQREYRMMALFVSIMHFCIAFFLNYYSGILRRGYFDEFKEVGFYNIFLFFSIIMLLFVLQESESFSRIVIIMFFFFNYIIMYLVHVILKKVVTKQGKDQRRKEHMLIVSSKDMIEDAVRELRNGPDQRYRLVGIAILEEDFKAGQVDGIPVVARGNDIYDYACKNVVDDIMLCVDNNENEKNAKIINEFLVMGIS